MNKEQNLEDKKKALRIADVSNSAFTNRLVNEFIMKGKDDKSCQTCAFSVLSQTFKYCKTCIEFSNWD